MPPNLRTFPLCLIWWSVALNQAFTAYVSHVQLFATLWTVTLQAPLSIGFSRQDTGVGSYALLIYIYISLHFLQVTIVNAGFLEDCAC